MIVRTLFILAVALMMASPSRSQEDLPNHRCLQKSTQLASAGACGQSGKELARLLDGFAGFGFSGAVLVTQRDTVLLHEAYGLANSESGQPNHFSTRFPLLSITKTMVATGLLSLVDEKKLDLSLPLETYLGEFPQEKSNATTHDLLTHTAGLILKGHSTRSPRRAEFVENVKKAPIDSPPSTKWRYSNAGYSLAAALIEVVADQSWEEYLSKAVFEPAGMKNTEILRGIFPSDVASGHRGEGKDRKVMNFSDAPPYVSNLWWGAAGATGVVSTVADVYRWMDALAKRQLLSNENLNKMTTAHLKDQGYAWHVDNVEGRRRVWKGGGAPMYESQIGWYPEDDLFIVIAINDHFGWRVPIWSAIEALILKGEFPSLPEVSDTLDTTKALSAGRYRTSGGEEIRLIADSGGLVYEPVGLAEGSRLPTKSLLMRPLKEGGFAGLEVVPGQPETQLTRLSKDEGHFMLILADGTKTMLHQVSSQRD